MGQLFRSKVIRTEEATVMNRQVNIICFAGLLLGISRASAADFFVVPNAADAPIPTLFDVRCDDVPDENVAHLQPWRVIQLDPQFRGLGLWPAIWTGTLGRKSSALETTTKTMCTIPLPLSFIGWTVPFSGAGDGPRPGETNCTMMLLLRSTTGTAMGRMK